MNEKEIQISEAVLKKLEIGITEHVSNHLLGVDVEVERFAEYIAFQVRGYVLSEEHQSATVKHPSDWWQSFKERWFAKWMLKRWPVEYTTHRFDMRTLYPDYRPAIPRERFVHRVSRFTWQGNINETI